MSGFNDNIFGGQIDNPFADPSVQQVAHNTTNTQRGLEDYNPFEDDNPPKSQPPVKRPHLRVDPIPPFNANKIRKSPSVEAAPMDQSASSSAPQGKEKAKD